MKKTSLLLTLVLILSMTLSSCQQLGSIIPSFDNILGLGGKNEPRPDPTSADELWERMDETMLALESYTSRSTISIKCTVADTLVTLNGTSYSIYINKPGEEFYYTTSSYGSRVDDGDTETSGDLIAYDDGVLYFSNTEGIQTSKLRSKISLEDFREFNKDNDEYTWLTNAIRSAFSKEFKKNEDFTWTLEYSKLAQSAVEELAKDFGFDDDILDFTFNDVSIAFEADPEFRATKMTMKFYADSDSSPIMSASTTYDSFNSAEKIDLDKASYTEVHDAKIAKQAIDYINDFTEQYSGSAIISIQHSQGLVNAAYKPVEVYSESNVISFENNTDAGYTFSIKTTADAETSILEYSDGTLTVTSNTSSGTAEITDKEARAYVYSMFSNTAPALHEIYDVEMLSDASYKLKCRISDLSRFGITGSNYKTDRSYYIIHMTDGEVTSITYHIVIEPTKYTSNQAYFIDGSVYFNTAE